MSTLDQIAVTIELTLISIIEGFALQALAGSALPALHGGYWIFIPYIVSGFLFLLVFWSQSVLHAVSFIRWPTRIEHMLLYFLAAFLQVITYGNLGDPVHWFFWSAVFSLLVLVIYFVDLWILRDSRKTFSHIPGGSEFLETVERRHIYEFKYLAPGAFVFNAGVFLLIYLDPQQFLGSASNVFWLGFLQAAVSAVALWDCVRNFRERTGFISVLFREQ